MPHADSAFVPDTIQTKEEFYAHVLQSLTALLEDKVNWITSLSNAASLLYNSFESFRIFARTNHVNWTGFYLHPSLFPGSASTLKARLLLAPFCGRPACQFVRLEPSRPGGNIGVCAEAFTKAETVLVPDVHAKAGHIACDDATQSEIVVPILVGGKPVGVLDLDCEAINAFDKADKEGLERIAELIARKTAWTAFT